MRVGSKNFFIEEELMAIPKISLLVVKLQLIRQDRNLIRSNSYLSTAVFNHWLVIATWYSVTFYGSLFAPNGS